MATNTIDSGRSGYREHFAQVGLVGLYVNGHDANKIVDIRKGTVTTLGIAAPGAAPIGAAQGAGNLAGTYSWRVRWKDSSTGAVSLASAIYTATPAANTWRITAPGSPPARVTHWILERTVAGGSVYYPINVDSTTPDGTPIATTTYDDNLTDGTIRNRNAQGFNNNQGQPRRYRFCWSNGAYLFMGGGRVHTPNCSLTNGAAALTSTDGKFTSDMAGQEFVAFDADTDGKTYKLLTYVNANSFTLAENYAGTTKAVQPCKIAGRRDIMAWSEPIVPGQPGTAEAWGAALPGGLQNELPIGNDGEPLTAGVGLGQAGCLICKERSMFYLNYRVRPNLPPFGDGQIVPLRALRGAAGPLAVKALEDRVYGMDVFGIWRLSPGGEPEEIGQALANDWKTLNFSNRDNFHIGFDALWRVAYFFVCGPGETYPKRAYLWDVDGERWLGSRTWPYGITSSCNLPDGNGALRLYIVSEAVGAAPSYGWFDNIGTSLGAPATAANLTGTVTSGGATSLNDSGAAWYTSGEKLKGIPVKLVRAADASEETVLIETNTGTALTTGAWVGTAPVAGDTYQIAPVETSWKTGRISAGEGTRKKKFRRLVIELKYTASVVPLKVRAYYDGSSTAYSYTSAANAENGVTFSGSVATITPVSGKLRYYIPLDGNMKNDVQFEFFSSAPGLPWELFKAALLYEVDDKGDPSKD
jgi:hypothetical protein